jgi:hypothetical protein
MSDLKQWVMQMRYPYTAGVIALMWIGSSVLIVARPEISAQVVLLLVALATLIIAVAGFSSSSH